MRARVSVAMLKTDGKRIMEVTGEKPGPRLGYILHTLLEEVLDDPTRNTEEYLDSKTKELASLTDLELKKLGGAGKESRDSAEQAELTEIRKKYGVK